LKGQQAKYKPTIMVHNVAHGVTSIIHLAFCSFYQGVQTLGMFLDLRRRRAEG